MSKKQKLAEHYMDLQGGHYILKVADTLQLTTTVQVRVVRRDREEPFTPQQREMRCITLLAHILPRRAREEWLGDLLQSRHELIDQQFSWWWISLITWGRVALLFWLLIKVKYQDLGSSKKG